MKGAYVLIALVLLMSSISGAFGSSGDGNSGEQLVKDMPTLENISLFIGAIPSAIGNIDFAVQGNLTMELVSETGDVDMLYQKNQMWLEDAILQFYGINGMNISTLEIQKFFSKVEMLPNDLQQAIALVIYSLNDATLSSRKATRDISDDEAEFLKSNNETQSDMLSLLKNVITEKMNIFPNLDLFYSESDKLSIITQKVNTEEMVRASLSLVQSVRHALPAIEKYGSTYTGTVLQDPSGLIVVGGGGEDAYTGNHSLIIDLGGSDVYNTGHGNAGVHSASLILDVSGDDHYQGSLANSFMGIDMLIDVSGNDFYSSKDWSQSYACAGVSLMLDLNGDDVYSAGEHSQGCAAAAGISVLADVSGNDVYHAGNYSQGFANGNSFSVLADVSGSDVYTGGTYSQGSATSGGIALLLDFLGGDHYTSVKNSQGAGEGWANGMKRISTGILADFSGDDSYISTEESQGFGQTAGAGILADFLGDDRYDSKSYSQACSKLFGMAFLMDMCGNNTYESKSYSGGYESGGGMSLLLDSISSTFNENMWELLQYISRNDISPISSFFGAVGDR